MELAKQIKTEYQKELKRTIKEIRAIKTLEDEKLKNWWYQEKMTAKTFKLWKENKITLKDLKNAMIKKATKENNNRMQKKLQKVEFIKTQEPIKHGVLNIYTNYSRTWGYSPKGDYRNGFFYKELGAVGGCGYDKQSTLSADFLNADNNFMAYLYNYIEKKHISKKNIVKKLGYGINMSYGLPYFEGGVGLSCHIRILKNLGFKVVENYNKLSITVNFSK